MVYDSHYLDKEIATSFHLKKDRAVCSTFYNVQPTYLNSDEVYSLFQIMANNQVSSFAFEKPLKAYISTTHEVREISNYDFILKLQVKKSFKIKVIVRRIAKQTFKVKFD